MDAIQNQLMVAIPQIPSLFVPDASPSQCQLCGSPGAADMDELAIHSPL